MGFQGVHSVDGTPGARARRLTATAFVLLVLLAPLHGQVPFISAFTPAAGNAGTTVVIQGSGFAPGADQNIVYFGPVRAHVLASTTTRLTVEVPAGATYVPVSVTVGGRTVVSSGAFLPTFPSAPSFGSGAFDTHVQFPSGATDPFRVAVADLDTNGRSDLVVAHSTGATLSLLRNVTRTDTITGASFTTDLARSTGYFPQSLAPADFDGDGRLDIAVGMFFENFVSVFRNISVPEFLDVDGPTDVSGFSDGFKSLVTADIDGDGLPDLVCVVRETNELFVCRNMSVPGTILFSSPVVFITGAHPEGIAVIDVDADNHTDVVVANTSAASVSVFRNVSTPGILVFAAPVTYAVGTEPLAIAAGDFDANGTRDVAIANKGSGTITILLNSSTPGTISLGGRIDVPTSASPRAIASGDINGDARPDLVVVNSGTGEIGVHVCAGIPVGFATPVQFPIASPSLSVVVADLTGNAKPELVAANLQSATVSVLLNTVLPPPRLDVSQTPVSFSPATIGGRSDTTVYLRNLSPAPLTITALGPLGPQFLELLATPATVAGYDSIPLPLSFLPDRFGTITDTLRIFSDGGDTTVILIGLSPFPELVLRQDSIDFGNVGIGGAKKDSILVVNPSLNALFIDSLYTLTAAFRTDSTAVTVPSRDSAWIVVGFTPLAPVPYVDTLVLRNNSSGGPVRVPLQGLGSASTSLTLVTGWNLVSVPRVASDFSAGALFPGRLDGPYAYNMIVEDFEQAPVLANGPGYFVLYQIPRVVTILGTSLDSIAVSASQAGWVLIGSLTNPAPASRIRTDVPGAILDGPFSYDPATNDFFITSVLEPGKGYWLLVNSACTMRIP